MTLGYQYSPIPQKEVKNKIYKLYKSNDFKVVEGIVNEVYLFPEGRENLIKRLSFGFLAEKLNLAKSTVWRIVRKLSRQGVILIIEKGKRKAGSLVKLCVNKLNELYELYLQQKSSNSGTNENRDNYRENIETNLKNETNENQDIETEKALISSNNETNENILISSPCGTNNNPIVSSCGTENDKFVSPCVTKQETSLQEKTNEEPLTAPVVCSQKSKIKERPVTRGGDFSSIGSILSSAIPVPEVSSPETSLLPNDNVKNSIGREEVDTRQQEISEEVRRAQALLEQRRQTGRQIYNSTGMGRAAETPVTIPGISPVVMTSGIQFLRDRNITDINQALQDIKSQMDTQDSIRNKKGYFLSLCREKKNFSRTVEEKKPGRLELEQKRLEEEFSHIDK